MVLIVYRAFFLLARKTLVQNLLYLNLLNTGQMEWVPLRGTLILTMVCIINVKRLYDQLISRLKGKRISIDVSVNSLSNEKF